MRKALLPVLLTLAASFTTQASVINTYTGSSASTHNCTGVDSEYIELNRDKIIDFAREVNYRNACEQSSYERNFEFEEFSKKFDGKPAITSISENVYAEGELDNSVLSLPEIHLYAGSAENSMSIGKSFAVQAYFWTGEDTTLSFSANLDYSASADQYDESGNRVVGAYYEAVIAASTKLFVSNEENDIFPSNFNENDLLGGDFYSSDSSENSGQERYEETQLGFSFDVRKDTVFYLFGRAAAYGWNGGYLDSRNTLTTSLSIAGATAEQSAPLIETFANPIQSSEISAPAASGIFLIGLAGLLSYRRKVKA